MAEIGRQGLLCFGRQRCARPRFVVQQQLRAARRDSGKYTGPTSDHAETPWDAVLGNLTTFALFARDNP
jgi:hypothetical protein